MSERESRSKRQRTSDVDYRERKRSKREEKQVQQRFFHDTSLFESCTDSRKIQASSELDDEEPISSVQNDCRKLFQTIKELEDPEE